MILKTQGAVPPGNLDERLARARAEMLLMEPGLRGQGSKEQMERIAFMLASKYKLGVRQVYSLLCDCNKRSASPWDVTTNEGPLSLRGMVLRTVARVSGGNVAPSVPVPAPVIAPAAPLVVKTKTDPRQDRHEAMARVRAKLAPLTSLEAFERELIGAFRVAGLVALGDYSGVVVCGCPACTDDIPGRLVVTEGAVECPDCQWGASGQSWEIAAAGKLAKAKASPVDALSSGVAVAPGDILAKLDARRISLTSPPARPVPVLSLGSQAISTAGNLTVAAAQAKSGKSAAVSAALAAVMIGPQDGAALSEQADCLGWKASAHQGRAVILFDTEQAPFDAHQLVKRAVERAGLDALPANVRAFGLVDLSLEERRAALVAEIERASVECGGICIVLLDGVADFVSDVNDPKESNAFVDQLMMLAARHSCPFLLVLHENPAIQGQNGGKTRGHLGSQLERKAESCLRLEKDGAGVVTLYGQRLRHGDVPKARGVCFAWSEQYQRHVSVEAVSTGGGTGSRKPGLVEFMALVPPSESISKKVLQELARGAGFAEKRVRDFLDLAIEAGDLHPWKVKNSSGPPSIRLARYAQPADEPSTEAGTK